VHHEDHAAGVPRRERRRGADGDCARGGANEAARHAVNALLNAAGSRAARATVAPLYRPPEFEALKQADARRYALGQPNVFDVPQASAALPGLPVVLP